MIQRIKTPLKPLLAVALSAVMIPGALNAQQEPDTATSKISERIVIMRTGDSKGKLTVEVDGDKITVNGKEVKKGSVDGVSVSHSRVSSNTLSGFPGQVYFSDPDHVGDVMIASYGNKAMLGVTTQSDPKGAKIISTVKNGGAEKAGIKVGDVVTRVDNSKIEKTDDITKAIKEKKPGDKVTVTYLRDGKEQKVTAELTKWRGVSYSYSFDDMARSLDMDLSNIPEPPMPPSTRVMGFGMNSGGSPKIGLSVQDTDDEKGVKVLSVEDESAAEKAGLKEDDIILEVDGNKITGTSDITRRIRDARTKSTIPLKIERNGKTQFLDLRFPRKIRTAEL